MPGNSKEDQIAIIANILPEYSQKLLTWYYNYENYRRERFYWLSLGGFFAGLAAIYGCVLFFRSLDYRFVLNDNIFVVFSATILLALGIALFLRGSIILSPRILRARKDIYILSIQLERVVRLASQIEEKAEADFARRLELSLRLSEAESILGIVKSRFRLENIMKNFNESGNENYKRNYS